jgi:hypothetical protein
MMSCTQFSASIGARPYFIVGAELGGTSGWPTHSLLVTVAPARLCTELRRFKLPVGAPQQGAQWRDIVQQLPLCACTPSVNLWRSPDQCQQCSAHAPKEFLKLPQALPEGIYDYDG